MLQLFNFADKYRGKYDGSIIVAQRYYQSFSGYGVSSQFPASSVDQVHWAGRPRSSYVIIF